MFFYKDSFGIKLNTKAELSLNKEAIIIIVILDSMFSTSKGKNMQSRIL